MPEVPEITEGHRYQTEWEGLGLVIEKRPDHFHALVYNPTTGEVLYTADRMSAHSAKIAAVEFAATRRFGSRHDLKPEVIAAMLEWERSD